MKKLLYILGFTLLGGILLGQLFGGEFLTTYGFLNAYHVQAFVNSHFDAISLFWNVLWSRGKVLCFLWIISQTPIRKILPYLLLGLLGIILGFYGTACVMNWGAAGILIVVGSIFPEWICYGGAILFLLWFEGRSYRTYRTLDLKKGTRRAGTMVLRVLLIMVLYALGAILEVTVGTWMLKKILRIFI